MRAKKADRRKKLLRILVVLALVIIIVVAAIYTYLNNSFTVALLEVLSTFEVDKVEYPSVQPGSIQLNITFTLDNPTDYSVTIDAVIISLYVDERYVIGMNVPLDENLPAGEDTFFSFIQNVTSADILSSIRNQSYALRVKGELAGSIHYLFVQTSVNRRIDFSGLVEGAS